MLMSVSSTLKHNHTKTCTQTGVLVLFTCPGASNVWPGGWMSACPSLCPAYAFTPLLPLPALLSSSLHPLWALCLLPPLCLLKRTLSVLTAPLILHAFLCHCSRSLRVLSPSPSSIAFHTGLRLRLMGYWSKDKSMNWCDAEWANRTELVTGAQ